MVDPQRLLSEGASEFERKLLSAALADAPSTASRTRIVAGLALGAALPAAGAAAASYGSLGTSWLRTAARFAVKRWGVSSVIGATAIATGVKLAQPEAPKVPPQQTTQAMGIAETRAPAAEAAPIADPPTPEEPADVSSAETATPPTTAAKRRLSTTPERSSLEEELRSLDAARAALSRGNAKRSLSLLDDYARSFRKPHLATEANVLRIEALIQSGDRARAEQLGREFLERHANSPYSRRVRSLIGANDRGT